MSKELRRQVLEMSVGILLHNLVLFGICFLWFRDGKTLLGVLFGALAAELLLFSIARSTEICAGAGKEEGKKKMAFHAMIRKFVLIAAFLLIWKFLAVNLLTVIIGTFGLKTGAYLYPTVHRILGGKEETAAPVQTDAGTERKEE